MRITPFPSRGVIRPDTSWALFLLPAFQHQVLDTHSLRGCGRRPPCDKQLRSADVQHSPARVAERVITDQIPAAVTSSPYRGIGAFYEGWAGRTPLLCTSSPKKRDFPATRSGRERSAGRTVDASKEGDPASLGPFACALTHPQRPTGRLHLPDPAGHSGDDSEAWSLSLRRVGGQCDKYTVCGNPGLPHCKGI